MPEVTPDDVADYAPGAPEVTPGQIEEARDWAEEQTQGKVLPDVGTRQFRALKRAICAYALALATGLKATTTRTLETEAAIKRTKVEGEIEVEFFEQKGQTEGVVISAGEWLGRARLALAAAGFGGQGWAFAGTSR